MRSAVFILQVEYWHILRYQNRISTGNDGFQLLPIKGDGQWMTMWSLQQIDGVSLSLVEPEGIPE
jgi:hypothetical protein